MAKHIHIHIHRAPTRDEEGFEESKHPRAANGEFAVSAGSHTHVAIKKAQASSAKAKAPTKEAWTKHEGGTFSDAELSRLRALRVPPAWTSIKLSADPHAALQVVGKDEKGRSQYLYSAAHSERAAAEKFARLKAFNAAAGAISTRAQQVMSDAKAPQKQRDAAAVVKLISETGFRVGSDADTGADVKAHGASTLTGDHVSVKGSTISFEFTGKKGVHITKTLDHPELARYIADAKKRNGSGPLFDVSDANVRDWMQANGGGGFKVKDFRTWNGTNVALKTIATLKPPTTAAEYKKFRAAVGKATAQHLGNTPTVALASYIDPAVFAKWSHLQ